MRHECKFFSACGIFTDGELTHIVNNTFIQIRTEVSIGCAGSNTQRALIISSTKIQGISLPDFDDIKLALHRILAKGSSIGAIPVRTGRDPIDRIPTGVPVIIVTSVVQSAPYDILSVI